MRTSLKLTTCLVVGLLVVVIVFLHVSLPSKNALFRLKYGRKMSSSFTKLTMPASVNLSDRPRTGFSTVQYGQIVRSHATIVTIFFRLNTSKHASSSYDEWNERFFRSATAVPVVVYTDRVSVRALIKLCSFGNNSKTFYVFDDIWSIVRLIELERQVDGLYEHSYRTTQVRLDPEAALHSPSLYAIWNAKPFVMKRTAEPRYNVYQSELFVYTDMGAFRERTHPGWPDAEHLRRLGPRLRDRVLFGQITPELEADPYVSSRHANYIEGGFFAGSPRALAFYHAKFFDIHDELLAAGLFVGKDQTMMNVFAEIEHAPRTCKLWAPRILWHCLRGTDIWFMYQDYLAPTSFAVLDKNDFFSRDRVHLLPASLFGPRTYRRRHYFFTRTEANCMRYGNNFFASASSVTCNEGAEVAGVAQCRPCRHPNHP